MTTQGAEGEFPVEIVNVNEEDLEKAARTPGVISIDDWLDQEDRRHRRTVVKAPGGFAYPQMRLQEGDVERFASRTAEIRRAVLEETEEELAKARAAVDLYYESEKGVDESAP